MSGGVYAPPEILPEVSVKALGFDIMVAAYIGSDIQPDETYDGLVVESKTFCKQNEK